MTQQSRKGESQKKDSCKGRSKHSEMPNKVDHVAKNKYNDNSNLKPFAPSSVKNGFIVKEQEL